MLTTAAAQMGLLGGGSFGISAFLSLISNHMENNHTFSMAALGYEAKDREDARKELFPFARRLIIICVFLLPLLLMFVLSLAHVKITVPYRDHYSWLFGLFHGDSYKFQVTTGFVLMMQPLADIMALAAGFYFGSKFKK